MTTKAKRKAEWGKGKAPRSSLPRLWCSTCHQMTGTYTNQTQIRTVCCGTFVARRDGQPLVKRPGLVAKKPEASRIKRAAKQVSKFSKAAHKLARGRSLIFTRKGRYVS